MEFDSDENGVFCETELATAVVFKIVPGRMVCI